MKIKKLNVNRVMFLALIRRKYFERDSNKIDKRCI